MVCQESHLAGSRLAFISVNDQILGSAITRLVHEAPLHPGGEASPATASQPAGLNLVDDPVSALLHDLLGLVPLAPGHGPLDPPVVAAIDVGEDPVLVSQRAVRGLGRGSLGGLVSDGLAGGGQRGACKCNNDMKSSFGRLVHLGDS